jgi:formiminoglutamate deiminase
MYRAAERLDPDRYHRLARATFAEMALAGVTVVGEFHYVHHQPDGTPYADPNAMGEALIAAADEAGIRITLLDTLYLHGGLTADGYLSTDGVQRRYDDGDAATWVERVDRLAPSPTGRIGAAIHSVRAVDPDAMRVAAAWADEYNAPVHAHVSEQQAENAQCLAHHGVTPTGLLRDVGVLGDRFTAVHATHLDDADLAAYATAGARVCLCPTTERDLGDGIGPSSLLAEAGIAMVVGSDSHATIDLLGEARAVELDQRLRTEGRGIHSAASLLAMATVHGHAALGWDDAGMISVGSRADLVTISLDSVRTAGGTADTAIETAVFAASAADVTHVVVDGIAVVTDGRHATIDVAAELRDSIGDVMDA